MPISLNQFFVLFSNHWINFWIVVQVFRAQLGLICVQEIQVWLYLLVQDIHEQCKFLNRMDFSAIFQQINLTISMSYMSFCNFNSKSDGYDFFPFKYSSSLSTSESRAKTFSFQSFSNLLCSFRQYLASPVLEKSRFFSSTATFSSLIRKDL